MDASEYTQYRPLMFSIAYRMTGSVSDAEDIVQEAFLRATKATARATDKPKDNPKAYLATITTRLAIDHLRSARDVSNRGRPSSIRRRDLAKVCRHAASVLPVMLAISL